MLASRRAIVRHANYATRLTSSIPHHSHQNLQFEATAAPTPEDLTQPHTTVAGGGGGEVDITARGSRSRVHKAKEREEGRDMAKAVAVGAIETGLELGKIGKQFMDGMWDAAEKTAHSVRDSIADDARNGRRRPVEEFPRDSIADDARDSLRRHVEDRSSDKFVEDLRRRDGGYDLPGRR